jgi:hypothetical protein
VKLLGIPDTFGAEKIRLPEIVPLGRRKVHDWD